MNIIIKNISKIGIRKTQFKNNTFKSLILFFILYLKFPIKKNTIIKIGESITNCLPKNINGL